MPILDDVPRYQIYILRCWEERSEYSAMGTWRFSLEDPRTGARHGFANLEAMTAFLQAGFDSAEHGTKSKDREAHEKSF